MFREIKEIISGQLVYNHTAYNYEQVCRGITGLLRDLQSQGQNCILTPYDVIFKQQRLRTGRQYSKVLRIPLKEGPYAQGRSKLDNWGG